MRLIDAGLVLDNLSGRLESMKDYDAVKDVINNMPTAYDPDKVVEQLENLKTINVDIGFGTLANTLRKEVVLDIVKGGGVDA